MSEPGRAEARSRLAERADGWHDHRNLPANGIGIAGPATPRYGILNDIDVSG
jgi:hypothetical protein